VQAVRLGRRGVLAVLDRCAGLVSAGRGEPELAGEQLGRALTRLAVLPYPLEEARTRLALGRVRARLGDVVGARGALNEAARVFARCGADPWLGLVTAELDALAVPAGRADGRRLASLTPVERRIALLVAQGATNRETAAALSVSVKTVEAALTRVYRKLGLRSRVALTRTFLAPP